MWARLNKPYYLYRPRQLVRRLGRKDADEATLPWGVTISFDPQEVHGSAILRKGVLDLPVTEALFRLTGSGETALDIGANIGHMTSVLAKAAGRAGAVYAFEPHPDVFRRLTDNVRRWCQPDLAAIELYPLALSDHAGAGALAVPDDPERNSGTSSLESRPDRRTVRVEVRRLTDVVEGPIGVAKVDVEGHELAVLEGAGTLLERGLIRDIVFEQHEPPPTAVTELLQAHGYTIFRLRQHLRGLGLDPELSTRGPDLWDPVSYLATMDPERALAHMGRRGWRCLRGG